MDWKRKTLNEYMENVDMNLHQFSKQNLVTTKNGDLYKCDVCGAEGWRRSLGAIVTMTEAEYKKASGCTHKQPESKTGRPKKVLTNSMPHIGIEGGDHEVVPCPEHEKAKFGEDVWIFSQKRGEPVRLLDHEYEVIE